MDHYADVSVYTTTVHEQFFLLLSFSLLLFFSSSIDFITRKMFFDDFTTITRQEQECQFETFNSGDALKLGCLLLENTNSRKRPPLIIDIVLNSHYAMNGTAIDDDYWVRSKM